MSLKPTWRFPTLVLTAGEGTPAVDGAVHLAPHLGAHPGWLSEYGDRVLWCVLTSVVLAAAPATEPVHRDKLRLGVAYRWWGRDFRASDTHALSVATVGPLPTGVSFDVQWYPATYFVEDRRADLGLALRVDVAPAFKMSAGDSGSVFTSTAMQLRTGLVYRFPFHRVEPSVQLGMHVFEATTALYASDGALRPRLPNVSLGGPRIAAGLRLLEVWRITFDVGLGGTAILSTGELGSTAYFPKAKGSAIDATLGLAFRTWTWLDLRVGVDVTYHGLDLGQGVTVGDAYYGISLGFIFKGVP